MPFGDELCSPERVLCKLDGMESFSRIRQCIQRNFSRTDHLLRMRPCMRMNYSGADHLGADHLDVKSDAEGYKRQNEERKSGSHEHASKISAGTTGRNQIRYLKHSWRQNLSNSKIRSQYQGNLHLNSRLQQSFSTRSGVEEMVSLHEKFDACCQEGNLKNALEIMKMMEKIEVVEIEDYREIVRMHGLAGHLEEAIEFVDRLPEQHKEHPSIISVWETLLYFSRVHGNVELGDRCAEMVDILDPTQLNAYEREGLLTPIASESLEERSGVPIASDCLEERPGVHTFGHMKKEGKKIKYLANDVALEKNKIIDELLRNFKKHMVQVGYVPDTSSVYHDVDEETKEGCLLGHSERAAFAHFVLESPPRTEVVILKNLRSCVDCHHAFKLMGKISGRKVTVSDGKRFHHFKDGECSCYDHW